MSIRERLVELRDKWRKWCDELSVAGRATVFGEGEVVARRHDADELDAILAELPAAPVTANPTLGKPWKSERGSGGRIAITDIRGLLIASVARRGDDKEIAAIIVAAAPKKEV